MNRQHATFFAACAEVAKESSMAYKLGAVVVKNRRVIGKGKNASLRPPPFDLDLDDARFPAGAGQSFLTTSLHAEAAAIRSCLPFTHRTSLSRLPPYSLPISALRNNPSSSSSSSNQPTPLSSYFTAKRPPKNPRHYASETPPLNGASLYVGRYNSRDEALTAKPCWRCLQAMRETGVKKVLWTEGPEVKGSKGFSEAKVEDLWDEFLAQEGNLAESEWLTVVERCLVEKIRGQSAEKGGDARCCGPTSRS